MCIESNMNSMWIKKKPGALSRSSFLTVTCVKSVYRMVSSNSAPSKNCFRYHFNGKSKNSTDNEFFDVERS